MKNLLRQLKIRSHNILYAAFVPLAEKDYNASPKLRALFSNDQSLVTYLNTLFKMAITVGAIIAVLRLLYAGYIYMVSDVFVSKEKAKEIFRDVFLGLFLLLSIYIILSQINPNLLNLMPKIDKFVPPPAAQGLVAPRTGGGKPLTIGSGACAPNVAAFGAQAKQMSCICAAESSGIVNNPSRQDRTIDGKPVSTGLYQINMSANPVYCPGQPALNCPSAFSSPLTGTNKNVRIANQSLYNQCLAAANTAACSTATAQRLMTNSKGLNNWSAWSGGMRSTCI